MRMRSVSSLFALLLAAGLVAVIGLPSRAAAQTAEPLTLTLTAERAECTAGTLNPVSWTITGGTAPYTLTVAGQSVDPPAESVNVTCGALPDGASEAPGTITASVRGRHRGAGDGQRHLHDRAAAAGAHRASPRLVPGIRIRPVE